MNTHRALAFAFATASLVGCSLVSSLDELSEGQNASSGGDGGSTSGGAGGSTGGDGGASQCSTAEDCAPPASRCIVSVCDDGACGYEALPDLTPIASQVEGDCQQIVCDADGGEKLISFLDDLPDDGQACTLDSCVNGSPTHEPQAEQPCPGGICSAAGKCVECIDNGQCVDGDICIVELGECAPPCCQNMAFDPAEGETDEDCGGPCPGCVDGLMCDLGEDCQSLVCDGTCQVPACNDTVKNGLETGPDCGGPCTGCGTGQPCIVPEDCTNHVCFGGTCKAPLCDDNVQNGTESDVDCGGSCARCGPGKKCNTEEDCADGLRCTEDGRCVDPCEDGKLNYQETDVDCGGPLCIGCKPGQLCKGTGDCQSKNCCTSVSPAVCGTNMACPIAVEDK